MSIDRRTNEVAPRARTQAMANEIAAPRADTERPEGASGNTRRRGVALVSAASVLIGCLCCVTPLVLLLLGLASVSAAASLDSVLSGRFAWAFRAAALLSLAVGLALHFRRQGICSLDAARRQRNRIMNTALLALFLVTGSYVGFNYIVLAYVGKAAGLPWSVERGAYPLAAVLLSAAALWYVVFFRRARANRDRANGPNGSRP